MCLSVYSHICVCVEDAHLPCVCVKVRGQLREVSVPPTTILLGTGSLIRPTPTPRHTTLTAL